MVEKIIYVLVKGTSLFFLQSLTDAMKTVCEILTADPDGGPARIPFPLFQDLYKYLAQIDGEISEQHITTVINYLQYHVWVHLYAIAMVLNTGVLLAIIATRPLANQFRLWLFELNYIEIGHTFPILA